MGNANPEYYSNHHRAEKFPWTLYHKPISKSLFSLIHKISKARQEVKILVIGPGAFSELKDMPNNCRFTCIDIDQRVVVDLGKIKDQRIDEIKKVTTTQDLDQFTEKNFDLIYAKEVIEHITDPDDYVTKLYQALKPGGYLWLSTPNYGFFLLPLMESTILEVIAKRDGFSRRDIHPSKYSKQSLQALFVQHRFKDPSVTEVAFKMALAGFARK